MIRCVSRVLKSQHENIWALGTTMWHPTSTQLMTCKPGRAGNNSFIAILNRVFGIKVSLTKLRWYCDRDFVEALECSFC